MPTPLSSRASGAHPSGLAPGTVVGGRFVIERAVGEDSLGAILAAKDQKTQRAIAVRVLAPGLIATEDAVETLRRHVKVAAELQHRNVVATYGMGTDKASGSRYVANEWIEGQSLAEVVASKAHGGEPMSLRGAYNVIAHVCRALEAVRDKGSCHGALRPTVVYVTKSGRVKIGSLGVDLAVVETAGPAALGAGEQAFLAPEVKAGHRPTTESDVFGIGGLLYTMLTGRSPLDEFVAPSEAHAEATSELDEVLMRCLAADPSSRFETPEALRAALVALAAQKEVTASHDEEDFGVEVDVDVDIGSTPPPAPSAPRVAPPRPPRPGAPEVGRRVAVEESFRVSLAPAVAAPAMSAEVDLSSLLSKITENDAPRWMVVKDNLDHGPFSGRELVNLILKGDVLAEHGLLNMDTGSRQKVGEAPDFAEFCEQWKLKKKAADHAVALERSAKVEKVSMATKALILGVVAAAVGVGVAIFLVTRPDVEDEAERADSDLADLYAAGQIEIVGTAGLLPDPPQDPSRPRRSGGGARGGSSYEDAMNQVVNLGNVGEAGGSQARLSAGQVAGVMNANINRLVPCLSQGSGGGNVRIDIAIAGSGRVLGASVRNGTPAFQRCVEGRVRAIQFPSFPAPRMGASYSFSAN
ncbi:MAG: serine/threonine protein kinase [Sandaracinaceae bacterium]|nr:serine/threonine protein kinase [Sandaracinaceae bacterium]